MRAFRCLLTFLLAWMLSTSYAAIPNHSNPTSFVGPTLRLNYAGWFTDTSAYNVLGEVGGGNYRINATAGFKIDEVQRLKITGEWLWQDIIYSFLSGNSRQWVNQGALGADYQYGFGTPYSLVFDLSGFASHAPSKTLSTVTAVYFVDGIQNSFVNFRRIAGSNAAGIAPGLDFVFWEGGNAGLALNYDDVHYDNKYQRNRKAVGFGGSAHINQTFGDFVIGASAEIRQPFNNYAANINWNNLDWYGRWGVGIFGEYNAGKVKLPSTWNIGLSLSYFMDRFTCVVPNFKGDMKGEVPPIPTPVDAEFLNWVNDPAVYMPQVLAIVDQGTGCSAASVPFAIGTPPLLVNSTPGPGLPYDVTPFFSGQTLTYSLTTTPAVTGGDSITIDPLTGIISTINGGDGTRTYLITVVATNGCGSATQTFGALMFDIS